MHKKRLYVAVLAMMLVMVLGGCGNSDNKALTNGNEGSVNANRTAEADGTEAEATRLVTDELGHEVKVPKAPVNIMAPYQEDSLLMLGITPVAQWSSGGTVQTYLQDKLADVPVIDMSAALSPEAVLQFKTDLLVLHTASMGEGELYEQYTQATPTYVFENALGDSRESLRKLGDLLGKKAEAEAALKKHDELLSDVKNEINARAGSVKIGIVQINSKKFRMFGNVYFAGPLLYNELGFEQPELVRDKDIVDLSLEVLPELDADFLFVIDQNGGEGQTKEIMESKVWKSVPAVKQNHMFIVDPSHWLGNGLIANEMVAEDVRDLILHAT
ncbi:ABC transporter substrate-binding protein [Paenibacillus sp. HB172176]|uniref:ABC transporter substrate-binding protein n=1 Tax=Paenibacillus sp. HB172176 TaxID=2493690 RepID=UPI00143A93B7|nr:ABC transporter substrate-binding protein [Paenibacillus sp. HB172176]